MRKIVLLLTLSASLFASLEEAAEEIIHTGIVLNQARLCPATAGNFSRKFECELKLRIVRG
jgi:hypothetical protein